MVAPLIGMLVANVAGKALSGSGEGKEGKEGGLASLIDPLGIMGGKEKKSNPIEQLLSMFTGGGEGDKDKGGLLGGAMSMIA